MKLTKNAYAKINLYLDVLSKMENGYHNIDSVMQSVSLCDKITLDIENCDGIAIDISAEGLKIPNDNTNLIFKATERFISCANEEKGVKIENTRFSYFVEKNIPVGAGMAGGSSDCATALKMLNEAFSFPFEESELLKIGAKIGADVSFCLTGGTAICQGIGDKITPLPPLRNVYLVSAIDNSSVSTPVAFKMLDDRYGVSPLPHGKFDEFISAVLAGDIRKISDQLYNKFESVILEKNGNVEFIKNAMLENGALGTLMSGSGPSVFGIFDDEKSQINAYNHLFSKKIRAFLCKTV